MEVSTLSYPDSERLFFGQMLVRSLENFTYEKDFDPKKFAGAYISPMYATPIERKWIMMKKETRSPTLQFYFIMVVCCVNELLIY